MKMLHAPRVEYPQGVMGPGVPVNEYIPADQVIGVVRNRSGCVYSRALSILFYLRDGLVQERLLSPIQTVAAWASDIADELEITLTKVDISLDTNYQYARLNLDRMVAANVGGSYQYLYFPTSGQRRLDGLRYTGKALLLPPERFVILPAYREETSIVVHRPSITSMRQRNDGRATMMVAGHEFGINLTLEELVDRLGGAADINIPE